MDVVVDSQALTISWGDRTESCRIGRNGAVPEADGREGDAATPLGRYPVRWAMWRADRLPRPKTALPLHPITEHDGWCDAPEHSAYNRWVRLPFDASHEKLWRDDIAYDILLVVGHNDSPPVPGMGSAVFVHLDRPDHRSTLGCVAVEPDTMLALLRDLAPGDTITIR